MPTAFLLRFQESCPVETSPSTTCATKTATFAKGEQNDADASRSTFRVVRAGVKMATQTCTDVKAEQTDSDPKRASGGVIPRPIPPRREGMIVTPAQMATQTVTEVKKEQKDADPRNSAYELIPPRDRNDVKMANHDISRIVMATQTATKAKGEAADQDPKSQSMRLIPRARNSY